MAARPKPKPTDEGDEGPAVDLEAVALALLHRGKTVREIAGLIGVTTKTVYNYLGRARARGLMGRLPGPREFAPRLDCTCKDDPLRPGEKIVCVECCASGWDFHPGLHARPLPRDKRPPQDDGLEGGKGRRRGGDAA